MSIERRKTRLTVEETISMVQKLPSLQTVFKKGENPTKRPDDEEKDTTNGILYLSRFNKPQKSSEVNQLNSLVQDSEDVSSNDHMETKSKEEATIMSGRHRQEKRRFAMSLATLAAQPEKRSGVVKEGAIPVLISMSSIPDKAILKTCASAFSSLSKEPKIRNQMIEEGSFAAIISLMSNPNREIASDCCRALCNLLCCEGHYGYEQRAVKDGAPFAIIHLMSTCPDIVHVCLKVLLNLSCVADKYSRLEEVTDALMHFNNVSYGLSTENEILVMSAICNLSALKNFQLRLVEDGCLRFVERVMKSPTANLRRLAGDVVRNLTTEGKTRIKLVDNGIISTLLMMSRDEVEDVRTSCVKAFFNLARDVTCREKIVNANAVSVIIKMSMEKFENVDLGRTAARILRILCGDSRIAHKLVRDGIIKALMALLRTDDGIIQQYCAESICSLFQIGDVMGRLIEQGAVTILVSLSQNNTDLVTGEWCAFALYHLATNKSCPTLMLEHGILPCIIKLCEVSSEQTKYFCAAALVHITQLPDVDASCSIPILVHMLRTVTDRSTTKTNCASALYNLADKDENCFMMLESGALVPVVQMTQSDHMQTKMKCAAILSRLSLHEQYFNLFATGNVLRVLLDLSCVDHIYTQRKVIIALSNLSQHRELRAQLLALNPIPYIISLASKCDENLRRGCASIVCNLSFEAGSEQNIVKGGIVPTLFVTAMVTSDQIASKIICVKALVNLMANRSLYKTMVAEGLIWGLSTLALLDDPELMMLCSKALCSLSCDFSREMLGARPAVKTVMKAVGQSEDLELLKTGARTLTNMLLQTTDADESFRLKAAENMIHLAKSSDNEVSAMCIICLCLASQSESSRETIVKYAKMIDASTIFTKPQVSYAYLTMFGNIANNPSMRTQLLDDKSISRFRKICTSSDPHLDMAVAKAIYCVSCAPENIPKLVDQNILSVAETLMEVDYPKSPELLNHLLACLYNLTTCPEVQYKLVSQGIVVVIHKLWDLVRDNPKMVSLACLAICHLACGSVNTNRMVCDGCTEILCFMAMEQNNPSFAALFEIEEMDRCAAGMRNLTSVISNQEAMVESGVIIALIELAKMAINFLHSVQMRLRQEQLAAAAAPQTPSGKRRGTPSSGDATLSMKHHHPQHVSIGQNCASALRSMTYNVDIRHKLLEHKAIDVILSDLARGLDGKADDMNISHTLLCELEMESWKNGSRGPQKEGRARPIEPGPLYSELLRGTHNVQLDVERRTIELEKFHVQVQVEEPKIELEAVATKLEVGIQNLASFGDDDDDSTPRVMQCPKQECEVSGDPMQSPARSAEVQTNTVRFIAVEDDEDSQAPPLPSPSYDPENSPSPGKEPKEDDSAEGGPGKPRLKESRLGAMIKSASANELPPVRSTKTRRKLRNPDEDFMKLVSAIKASKQSKGALIDDVMGKWKAMPK